MHFLIVVFFFVNFHFSIFYKLKGEKKTSKKQNKRTEHWISKIKQKSDQH